MEGGGANPGDDVVGLLVEGGLGPADVRARLMLLISSQKNIFRATKYFGNETYFEGDEILHKSTIQITQNVPYRSRGFDTSQNGRTLNGILVPYM